MNDTQQHWEKRQSPWAILGVAEDADEKEIRAAYLRQVKVYPPEREPEQFERIRDAYEALQDQGRRIKQMLFAVDPTVPFVSLLQDREDRRRWVGPEPWQKVIKNGGKS